MPTFDYSARDKQGLAVRGAAAGGSLEAVLADLRGRGLSVDRIEAAPEPPGSPEAQPFAPRSALQARVLAPIVTGAPLEAVAFFFRQLATLLGAGVPINQSLATLGGQARDVRMRPIAEDARRAVLAGLPMSEAFARYPEAVTPVMLSVVRAGEEGGFLDAALGQVADYLDQEIALRSAYRRATFYPKLALGASFVCIAAANAIISEIMPGAPGLASPISIANWLIIAAAGVGAWLFLRVGRNNPAVQARFDAFVLRLPVLGYTLRQLAMAKFGRAFAALYKAGVPISRALVVSADACGNEHLRRMMLPQFRRVGEGAGIAESLARTGAFTPLVLDMLSTGESSGNIEVMLEKVSAYYEMEAANRQSSLATVTGVFVLLLVGAYVGAMVIEFWMGYAGRVMSVSGG